MDALDFLTLEEKENYKSQIINGFAECFYFQVYRNCRDGLQNYLKSLAKEDEGYWAAYEKGSEIFEMELEHLLGLNDFDINKYIAEVQSSFQNIVN